MTKHVLVGNRDEIARIIDNYIIGYKSKRNREILKDHFLDGMTFEEVAEKHKMSVRQVKKIAYEYEVIIRAHLKKDA